MSILIREQTREKIRTTAEEINNQSNDAKVKALLALGYMSDVVSKYIDMELSHQPVSRSGFKILFNLTLKDGNMMPTEIAKIVLRSKHSVTKVLDTLEKQGYVKRTSNNADRRIKSVIITRKGINLVKKDATSTREHMSYALFEDMDEKTIAEFNRLMGQISAKALSLMEE